MKPQKNMTSAIRIQKKGGNLSMIIVLVKRFNFT